MHEAQDAGKNSDRIKEKHPMVMSTDAKKH